MDALRMEGVHLDYPGRPGVLHDVDLQVPQRSLVILEGRSGSGKSTLLMLAAGLMPPTRGRVFVQGEPMPEDPERAATLRGEHIGLVFQHLNLLGELTVAENVGLPLRLRHLPRQERLERVGDLLQRFGLTALRDQRPGRLSGGEQQRVAIARALALRPGLLLVDEPTGSLDRENAATVIGALQEAARSGAGVLVATHDPLFRRAGSLYQLHDGRPVWRGA